MSEKLEQDVSGTQTALTTTASPVPSASANASADADSSAAADTSAAVDTKPMSKPTAFEPTHEEGSADSDDPEVAALHSLYKKAVHLVDPEPVYQGPDEPIAKMTHHELRALRSKHVSTAEVKVPLKESFATAVIKMFDDFLQSFKKTGQTRRLKCLDAGHECMHCGKKFVDDDKKSKDKKG